MVNFKIDNLKKGAKVHMIGIGGVSMSALAEILLYFGFKVSGSDSVKSPATERLRSSGAQIFIGQSADNIKEADLVCYTAAIKEDNPEFIQAKKLNLPMLERAQLLGIMMKNYKFPLAVAGTHGKTSTTSMLALILLAAEKNPTILVGGTLPQIDGNLRIGDENYLVFEACEYVDSFLNFHPFLSIITNIEEDHLDYFVNLSHIISSFEKFARLNSPLGSIIVCSDDKNIPFIVQNIEKNIIKYAISDKTADFLADNIKESCGKTTFDIIKHGKYFTTVTINVIGSHNILNALAAAAAADSLGIGEEYIRKGLSDYSGAKRRFERLGTAHGAEIIDDYAHHPTEIKATLNAAKKLAENKVWCIFQPHTYTRTKAFLDGFAEALSLADKVVLADVFPAREKYDGSIHSCDLAAKIPGCTYINDFSAIKRYVEKNIEKDDIVIFMGAGNINKIGYEIIGNK